MKILTYNINLSLQEKIDKILEVDADLYILPEVANPSMLNLPKGYRMEWMGDFDFKGLGVIWKPNRQVQIPSWFNRNLQYFMPLLVDGNLILASWPTKTEQNKPMQYTQIAMTAIEEYASYIKQYPTIITGDFNCYKGQSGETKKCNIETISVFLKEYGLFSAYHKQAGEVLGEESKATYYHQFKKEKPFFIDYTFSSIPLKSFALGEWDSSISDHVPQYIGF